MWIQPWFLLLACVLVAPWSVGCVLLGMRLQYRQQNDAPPPSFSELGNMVTQTLAGSAEDLACIDTDDELDTAQVSKFNL